MYTNEHKSLVLGSTKHTREHQSLAATTPVPVVGLPLFVSIHVHSWLNCCFEKLNHHSWFHSPTSSITPTAFCVFATWAIGTTRSMVCKLKIPGASRELARQSMFPRAC